MIDINEAVVTTLNNGRGPLHKPGLDDLITEHAGDSLHATSSYAAVSEADVTFLGVQTPSGEDGSIDMSTLIAVTEMTGEEFAESTDYERGDSPRGTAITV